MYRSSREVGMVRPKASEANLRAAVAFVNILIVREQLDRCNERRACVYLKGSGSLYAAFRALLPELTRGSLDKNPDNRQGVTTIELNKALKRTGLKSARKRNQTEDGMKRRYKVTSKVTRGALAIIRCFLIFEHMTSVLLNFQACSIGKTADGWTHPRGQT